MKLFPPLLSASLDGVDLRGLRYPLLASPKFDGIRCVIWEGIAYSRNGKPLRNYFLQEWASHHHNVDGEIIVGSPTDPLCLNRTHAVMAYEGQPDFKLYAFDRRSDHDFIYRLNDVHTIFGDQSRFAPVEHVFVTDAEKVQELEDMWLEQGYEGLMLRDPQGKYKNGYSTVREGILFKLKRFTDGEAVVRSLEPALENLNPLQKDEMGYAKRSTHQANLIPKDMIGTLICDDAKWGELRIAPGTMPHEDRVRFFKNPELIVGKSIHWRSFGYGLKDKPRFARYYGIREDL